MIPVLKNISALLNAYKYSGFSKGVRIELADGEERPLMITQTKSVIYPPGLRFSRHAFRSEAKSGEIVEVGYGEDDSKLLAYEKSISEAIERLIFRLYKNRGLGTNTSSGWSSHLTRDLAQQAAFEELAERDAVLVHWLRKLPMLEIDPITFPKSLKSWLAKELALHKELKHLRILLATEGYCPIVTVILQTGSKSSIVSHGTASNLFSAYKRAMTECCRLASNLDHKHFFESSKNLRDEETTAKIKAEDHGMYYAFHQTLPSWLFGDMVTWCKAESFWKACIFRNEDITGAFTFNEIVKFPLSIGYAESKAVQNLYFGTTKAAVDAGRINFSRLNLVGGSEDLNMMPHFIS